MKRFRRLPETECPKCGGRDVRPAKRRGIWESLAGVLGFQPARCHDCASRFLARPFGILKLRWAKCPQCYRLDLTTWETKYYHVSGWMSFKLAIGANRWRCEACRRNFVSFRPRQRKYVRREAEAVAE